MTEEELRIKFNEAVKGRESLKGFWHTRVGRELRAKLKVTSFDDFDSDQEKVWSLTNNQVVRPKCVMCEKPASFYQYGYLETCSTSCGSKLIHERMAPELKAELQARRVEASKSDESREKRKNTMLDTMAVHGDDIMKKRMVTCINKYGTAHPLQSDAVQQKLKHTNLQRYGHAHVLASPEIKRRRVETTRRQYEQEVLPTRLEKCKEAGYTPCFETWLGADVQYEWIHDKCGQKFMHSLADGCIPSCPACRPRSKPEQKVVDLVHSLGFDLKHNDRSFIKPRELDILIPDKKLAIEVNGVYWHQDGESYPLVKKTNDVEAQGYQLLHFWDYEITEKFDLVESIIRSKLGVLDKKIGASRCKIKLLDTVTARAFANENHLSGYANSSIRVGLEYKGQIVALATFGKTRFSNEDALELIRFCVLKNHHVHGALSKLCQFVIKTHQTPIVSFADRRISVGNGYSSAGFKLVGTSAPNYWYVKNQVRLPRYACMKHKLPELLGEAFEARLTERENMLKAGWIVISDSGNLKFKMDANKTA